MKWRTRTMTKRRRAEQDDVPAAAPPRAKKPRAKKKGK